LSLQYAFLRPKRSYPEKKSTIIHLLGVRHQAGIPYCLAHVGL